MITNDVYNLVLALVDGCVTEAIRERTFRDYLMTASDADRTEIAHLMADKLNSHPDRPSEVYIPLERVERYMANRMMVADWKIRKNDLDEDLQDILAQLDAELGFYDDGDIRI